jgi:predicted nucleic acid-binding protein
MIIYLDICCFNRPYDDQSQNRIFIETEAKLFIQQRLKKNEIELVWSYILDYENSANPDIDISSSIEKWENLAKFKIEESDFIIKFAKKLYEKGFGIKDSLHIACAVDAKSDFFITVDKGILNKRKFVDNIRIVSPTEFIEMEV